MTQWVKMWEVYPTLAYVYILFYSMIKEADMRLSPAVSVY
jgi:hypothetical protein